MQQVNLQHADLTGARLDGADVQGGYLFGATLEDATLDGAAMAGVRLQSARLGGASLRGADVQGAYLEGAWLSGVDLTGANLQGATVDAETYHRSAWGPEDVAGWCERGGKVVAIERLPLDAVRAATGRIEGLTLYFRSALDPIDRLLVDGILLGVLGRDTDCRVADFAEEAGRALLRLTGSNPEDLISVANALHARLWERGGAPGRESDDPSEVAVASLLAVPALTNGLSLLIDRGDRFELWVREASGVRRSRQWPIEVNPEQALAHLLIELLQDGVRTFVRLQPEGEDAAAALPGPGATPASVAASAVEALRRRGAIDRSFFDRLAEAFPRREQHVRAVARLWFAPAIEGEAPPV